LYRVAVVGLVVSAFDSSGSWPNINPTMSTLDFSHLSQQERLDLIEALWESLEAGGVALTNAQACEIDSRVAMLDANPQDGRDAFDVLADFRRRFG